MRIQKLALVATLAALSGCSSGSSTGGTTGTSGSTGGQKCTIATALTCSCTKDTDCPGNPLYLCNLDTRLCEFNCASGDDCTSANAPDDTKALCTNAALGCACEIDPVTQQNECVTKVCGTNLDCGTTNVCVDGQCTAPTATSTIDSCKVFPEAAVLHVGSAFPFTAQAYKAGKPVFAPASAFTWTGDGAASTGIFTPTAATTAAAPGVTATINGKTCNAQVQVYGAPAALALRVVVVDSLAGVPVAGAKVVLGNGTVPAATTDASGVATFAAAGAAPYTVSVFHADFGYVTIAGTTAADILVPLSRNATDKLGGVKGSVANLFTGPNGTAPSADVHAGIVGMSIAGGISDISFDLLLGASVPTHIAIGSTEADVGLPSGVLLGLSTNKFKETYSALGRAGFCDDATKTAAGTCGTRSIWGLGGDVPISKLPISQLAGGGLSGGNLNIGPILTQLLPVFRNFHSMVVRDVPITLGAKGGDGNVDPAFLTTQDLDNGVPPAVKLAIKTHVKIPELPKQNGSYVDGIIVLAGTEVPGRGLIPLGLSAGVDDPGTGVTDGHVEDQDETPPKKDQLTMNLAPTHGGTEGSPYKVGIIAASFKNISGGLSASAIITSPTGCGPGSTTGICYGGTIDVGSATFPKFPEGASFNYVTRHFTAGADAGATIYRTIFADTAGHRWIVFAGHTDFDLPTPPAGFGDRTRADDATGDRSGMTVQAITIDGSDFNTMAAFNGTNLDRYDLLMTKFAITDYAPPTIAIVSPAASAAVGAGSTVKVTIKNDSANGNNWRLCFTTSSTAVTSTQGCSAGSTTLDGSNNTTGVLPTATGAGFIHAVLVDSSGAPLNPTVEASEAITVNP
jgi:hypothetical protein